MKITKSQAVFFEKIKKIDEPLPQQKKLCSISLLLYL